MVKNSKYSFERMAQDITESKDPGNLYFSAKNIRFITHDDKVTGAYAFEKGNKLQVTIPNSITIDTGTNIVQYDNKSLPFTTSELTAVTSTGQQIIGHAVTRDSIIFISTDDSGNDCVWEVDNDTFDLTLLYIRNMNLNTSAPIQILFNYENEDIQKIYWVDGVNQLRSLNIKHENIEGNSALIDIPLNTINLVGNIDFSQPTISSISSGGSHTSGMIQYAYNLYRLNSSQTKISPLSELIPLDKRNGLGGGDVNEVVGSAPIVNISDLDQSYDNIKIYAIKYTSYNQTPTISLIDEREIPENGSISLFDDGTTIESISLEEFLFLGSDPIIPRHIEAKDNILFPINTKSTFFDLPDEVDCRAYSYTAASASYVYDDVRLVNNVPQGTAYFIGTGGGGSFPRINTISPTHDAVNLFPDTHRFQFDGTTLGAEGRFLKLEVVQGPVADADEKRFFKDKEFYRFGIQFYNNKGQLSPPKWICDYKMPTGNLEGNYNTIKVTLKTEFFDWLSMYSGDAPVGFKVIRADRLLIDRTILDQGIVNPTMFQVRSTNAVRNFEQFESLAVRQTYQDAEVKLPSVLTRTFQKFPNAVYSGAGDNNGRLGPVQHLRWLNDNYNGASGTDESGEIYTVTNDQNKIQQSFQHSKLMQFYSPEILFDINTSFQGDTKLRVLGTMLNTTNGIAGEERDIATTEEIRGGKTLNGINPQLVASNLWLRDNGFDEMFTLNNSSNANNRAAFIAPSGFRESMDFHQYYRAYTTFDKDTAEREYAIYGAPEVAERGQGLSQYNNDSNFSYVNSLETLVSDPEDSFNNNDDGRAIAGVNSFGCRCGYVVLGSAGQSTNSRKSIEDLYNESNLADPTGILMTEIVRDSNFAFVGGMYGGNTYEDKLRTSYIEIGEYQDIVPGSMTQELSIINGGDTYVQNFRFSRIQKTDTEVYSNTSVQVTEIVEFKCETSVNLINRHDISTSAWDSRFQPRDDEYHLYNRVYSQQPNLVQNNPFDFTFREVKTFDTRVSATKTKVPNETIDSWTDILLNENLDLDGKYGAINAVENFRDNIYVFQDNAFAVLGINPRVQVQGSDGVSVELGTGGILYDYQYISTKSGCINKWGTASTESYLYFIDGLNKGFLRFGGGTDQRFASGSGFQNLSIGKNMHKYFRDNISVDNIIKDNPVLNTGVVLGHSQQDNEIYISYLDGSNDWCLAFNELQDGFSSFYDYNSSRFIYNRRKMFSIGPNNDTLYENFAGDYNIFYGVNQYSEIIFLVNPEVDHEVVFNNLEYKAEALNATTNQEVNYTWEQIRAYNEFQDSGLVTPKLRKLNRKHRMVIPRNQNSTDRIRNTWAFIQLRANNADSNFYRNNDMILYYNPRYIIQQ